MIDRIKRYKRYRDYYALSSFEVRSGIACAVIISWLLFDKLEMYELFQLYQSDLKQIISVIIGGEFSLLGMSLAGMAIITSIFSQDEIKIINSIDTSDTINRVLSQFEFFALNIGFQMVYLIAIYLMLTSNKLLIDKIWFVTIFLVIVYHFCFNIFYIISLIENCIKINEIKGVCTKIATVEKSNVDIANELRIDYILKIIIEERNIDKARMLDDLFEMLDKTNIQNPQKIKDYLQNYYYGKKK